MPSALSPKAVSVPRGFGAHVGANLVAKLWIAVVSIALTPLYIRLLGLEAFGLISFFIALQAALAVLDIGLGLTLNREFAHRVETGSGPQPFWNLLRTFELTYWCIGGAQALVVFMLAPTFADVWLRAGQLAPGELAAGVRLMSVVLAVEWPSALYTGALLGLGRQVQANLALAVIATVRAVGAALFLTLVPTVSTYFAWQACAALAGTGLLRFLTSRYLGRAAGKPRFDFELLRNSFRFAAFLAATTVLAAILTQIDKLLLSGLVPLQEFGYYALAATVVSALYVVVGPIFNVTFPRFVALSARRAISEMAALYHVSSQAMAALVIPAGLTLAMFSSDVLYAWLGDSDLAHNVAPVVSLLALGMILNGLMNPAYALMVATGSIRLPLIMNTVALIVMVPLIVILTRNWGIVGASAAWLLLNVGYVTFGLPFMHVSLLKGELARWYLRDFAGPAFAALLPLTLFRIALPSLGRVETAAYLLTAAAFSLGAALLASPLLRSSLRLVPEVRIR